MRTVLLTLAYDGTHYAGWQVQPDRPTIQQVVEQAIGKLTGESVKVAASGRTDAGVHALGQLVTFNSRLNISLEAYRRGLITQLPDDVVVLDAQERPYGFHARFDTVRKTYRYVIHLSPTPAPWLRQYVWWQRGSLNFEAMQQAAAVLTGTHDFRCFETQWPNRESSVRTIFAANWSRWATWQPWSPPEKPEVGATSPGGSYLCFDVTADGFLYNMVRAIVGTLIHVGRGRWTAADVQRILETGDRCHAGDTAPAQGLYLAHVETELREELLEERRRRIAAWEARQQESEPGVPPLEASGDDLAAD